MAKGLGQVSILQKAFSDRTGIGLLVLHDHLLELGHVTLLVADSESAVGYGYGYGYGNGSG